MKDLYHFDQQARDEANNLTSYNQQKQEALRTIHKLAVFYEMIIYSDEQSESERTEIDIQENVDVYMKVLLDKWGMDWSKVCEIAQRTMKLQQAHTDTKELSQIV
ncbi:predicted protein [Histoplasma capsulatum var. duboisii H88]|uniref:Predicted protein n=1 Tax=Ajellomyces capsulatus (strain H88) TaxID=544711 RepID=F0UQM0_AJEC8|nr:predicted protein [Histoplasma capsulatum var. duboisii H88]